MVTKFFKVGVEIVQYRIETWKDAEIEAAYQAFRNGADSNKANEQSDNKTGTIQVVIPMDYQKDSLDILVEASLPSGSGGMTYHYVFTP
jgi:hypothetical protein